MIDTHTHVWGPSTEQHPWIHDEFIEHVSALPIPTEYTAEVLLEDMSEVGIDEAVVVGFPIYTWNDNWYTVEAVTTHEELVGIGLVDPFAEDVATQLRSLLKPSDMIGFRLGALYSRDARWAQEDPDATWLRETIDEQEFWTTAREEDAVVQILCDATQLDQVHELVEEYPDLTYVIDHLARVTPEIPLTGDTFGRFESMAEFENVFPKISALPFLSDEGYPYPDLHDHVRALVEWYGPERLIWGSDYQFESEHTSYRGTYEWMDDVSFLSPSDIRWLTERTFRERVMP